MMESQAEARNPNVLECRRTILVLFGTRPEIIKLAPVIQQLQAHPGTFRTVVVNSGQHTDLLTPFLTLWDIPVDWNLEVLRPGQTSNQLCARLLAGLEEVLAEEQPDLLLVQGDTTTALAGALACFHRRVPVGHVEAGLRSHQLQSPFPEEMNRRLISQLATYHFAPTERNKTNLLKEGIPAEHIFVTGNPVVDSLQAILHRQPLSTELGELLQATEGLKRLVLTTHRRERFEKALPADLRVIRDFVASHTDVALFFPVHPNPAVRLAAQEILAGQPRIYLLEPLSYGDFLGLLAQAWLILSDSGGVQEEVPTLGKPLLILREYTERPEILEAGVARLVGDSPVHLQLLLEELYGDDHWLRGIAPMANPFGAGDSGGRIAGIIARILHLGAARAF